jgi:hydrogenase maturation protease
MVIQKWRNSLLKPDQKTLIMGLGNVLLQDEGIGVHTMQELEKRTWPEWIDLLDGGTGGFVLLSLFQEYKNLIIIDATLSEEPEGTIKVLRPKFAKDFPRSLSTHELGLKDMIESAILLGQVPDIYLVTVAINPEQQMNMDLTENIKSVVPEVVNTVIGVVESIEPS